MPRRRLLLKCSEANAQQVPAEARLLQSEMRTPSPKRRRCLSVDRTPPRVGCDRSGDYSRSGSSVFAAPSAREGKLDDRLQERTQKPDLQDGHTPKLRRDGVFSVSEIKREHAQGDIAHTEIIDLEAAIVLSDEENEEQETAEESMQAWLVGPRHVDVQSDLQPQGWLQSVFSDKASLASAGHYHVYMPDLRDVSRLRELEREFVLDHYNIFSQEPWHTQMTRPLEWCNMLSVIPDETEALQAISQVVLGNSMGHLTLKCVYAPTTGAEPRIVGYIHITTRGGLEIAHLKVEKQHQGQGLGALLLAGIARAAERLDVKATEGMNLVVLARNTRAVALYSRLRFAVLQSQEKPLVGTAVSLEWLKMTKSFSTKLSWSVFAELCERVYSRRAVRAGAFGGA